MKCFKPKNLFKQTRLLFIVLLGCFISVIYGCKKEAYNGNQQATAITDPSIKEAKSWYESVYPLNNNKQSIQSTTTTLDFSQRIKPDWNHAVTYNRFDDDIIEMPLDSMTSAKMNLGLKNETGDQVYNSSYSRSSFLLIKQLGKYNAYIMTIIADPAYLKGDLRKLDHNKYNKRDSDFSGVVVYSTPKGVFVNGWTYKKGIITGNISGGVMPTGNNNTVSHQTTQNLETNTFDQKITVCTEWYQIVTVDGASYTTYLGESCSTFTIHGGGGGSGGPSGPSGPGGTGGATGGGSGSSSGGTPVPSTPCDLVGLNSVENPGKTAINSLKIQTAVTPIGGFPPPTGYPCPTTNVSTVQKNTPNFGMDNNCLNCRVLDSRFDAVLDYARNTNCIVTDPYNTVLTVNGVNYAGQATLIYNADGSLAAAYFSPDVSSGPFQTGIEYSIGNKGPDGNNSTGYGKPDASEFSPAFGNGTTTVGAHVTYLPPHDANGNVITPAQRQALEAADNTRILQLMQREDALDDAPVTPCHGTSRNGNVKWPGTAEHWLIQYDYIASHPEALREFIIPGSSGKLNGNPGYADIVNPQTNEMFEIKPNNRTAIQSGTNEIQLYVTQGNLLCPPLNGSGWIAGGNYLTRYLPDPKNPSNVLQVKLAGAGVIVYESLPRNGQPAPVPVVLPENLAHKLKSLFQQIALNPLTMQQQIVMFVRQNPKIIPYLKGAAASVIIGTLLEDIATEGVGIADDWQSFIIARTLWRVSNEMVLI